MKAAQRLHNLFIKIPGTKEGLPAIEDAIFAGVPATQAPRSSKPLSPEEPRT
jgi:hypothetical protein